MKNKKSVLIFFIVCLLFFTKIVEAQATPNWVQNRPRNTNETIYTVAQSTGETLEAARNTAWVVFYAVPNTRMAISYAFIDRNYMQFMVEMGQNAFILDLADQWENWWDNNIQLVDEYFFTNNEGMITYYALYALQTTTYNALFDELIFWYVPAFKDGSLENAIYSAANQLASEIPSNVKVAIINVASTDNELGEFMLEEITGYLSSTGTIQLFDRVSLDSIRTERNFQMTSDVDDNSAVRIGHFAGADIVITGSITGSGATRRLRFKALDVETAAILSQTSHRF